MRFAENIIFHTMLYKIMAYALIGVIGIFAYVKYIELRGVYYPSKNIYLTPASLKLPFEDVSFKTGDTLTLHGWFIPGNNGNYTVFVFHGNAGNISDRIDKIILLRETGANIFIFDYRGFGVSQGSPSERGFYLDAKAAYDYLLNTRNIPAERIIFYGESLGAGVALHLASEVKYIRAIIVEGAFSCGRDMAKVFYPFIPVFFFSDSFNSLKTVKNVHAAKLFLHSQDDEVVPLALSRKLYESSPEPKSFVELRGGHNTAFLDSKDAYVSAIKSFINQL
jgi:fermentation-respiration switch protein FrsA (DUF1100 family)